ncbi:hypothetical protein H8D59_01125 [bacterium]|nr:hypothetical protein [bacterium]
MRVYLAGAIEKAPDGGKEWRREETKFIDQNLGWKIFDPTLEEAQYFTEEDWKKYRSYKRENFPKYVEMVRTMIDRDLEQLLGETDIVICKWDEFAQQGGGTAGELTMAYFYKIQVYMVVSNGKNDVPGWILACAEHIFEDFDALNERLLSDFL